MATTDLTDSATIVAGTPEGVPNPLLRALGIETTPRAAQSVRWPGGRHHVRHAFGGASALSVASPEGGTYVQKKELSDAV